MNYIFGSPARKGPEADLVLSFLSTSLPKTPKGLTHSIFIERNLENSLPDIVIIYWDLKVTNKWPQARKNLKRIDYKLIQFLHIQGIQRHEILVQYFPKNINKILERLLQAEIIIETVQGWELKAFNDIYAAKQIVSIEAKMTASTKVFMQAMLNARFASESYVLTKSKSPRENSIMFAQKTGIGLWSLTGDDVVALVTAKEQPLPQSYLSWELNDMAWQDYDGGKNGYRC